MTDEEMAKHLMNAWRGLNLSQGWLPVVAEARRLLAPSPEAQAVIECAIEETKAERADTRAVRQWAVVMDCRHHRRQAVEDYEASLRPPEPPKRWHSEGNELKFTRPDGMTQHMGTVKLVGMTDLAAKIAAALNEADRAAKEPGA